MTTQTIIVQDHSADLAAIRQELAAVRSMLEGAVITPRPEWMTVADYAALIGKSARTVKRMIADGKVETKHAGHVRLIRV